MTEQILHINGIPITKISTEDLCHFKRRFDDLVTIKISEKAKQYRIAKRKLDKYLKEVDKTGVMCKLLS